jgi:hypothetical protein
MKFKTMTLDYYPDDNECRHYSLELQDTENVGEECNGYVDLSLSLLDNPDPKDNVTLSIPLERDDAENIVNYLKQQFNL